MSTGQVASLLTDVLGRKITHERLSADELKAIWTSFGLGEKFALWYINAEDDIARGTEEAFLHGEEKEVGKRHLLDYFREKRDIWIP
ncbi:hypothetical protein LshimejAT787_0603450 [Lyophyllum shimeji]|uniref:Uncharacterized protein n=1 Tax=Lyophyllum shimeji TaxID=47721 RepID=A0A9P3PPH3_LYOSH|nr:hypothetical protein LshimejAT787_0603450 [Lyophyllum shimeji]